MSLKKKGFSSATNLDEGSGKKLEQGAAKGLGVRGSIGTGGDIQESFKEESQEKENEEEIISSRIENFLTGGDKIAAVPSNPIPKPRAKRPHSSSKAMYTTVPSKSKPYQFDKVKGREQDLLFEDIYDENLKLKKQMAHLTDVEDKMKRLTTQMNHMKVSMTHSLKKDFKETAAFDDNYIDSIQKENELLKSKLKAVASAKGGSKVKTKTKKYVSSLNTGGGIENEEKTQELLRMIDKLKSRLKESDLQIKALMEGAAIGGKGGWSSTDIQRRNLELASMRARYEDLENSLEGQKKTLEFTKKKSDDLALQLKEERLKNNDLERQLRSFDIAGKGVKDLERELDETKRAKENLEMKLNEFFNAPFMKEHEDRATLQVKARTAEEALKRQNLELRTARETLIKSEEELRHLKNDLTHTREELKEMTTELAEQRAMNNAKDNYMGQMKDLDLDNDQFLKVLGEIKWRGEEPAWLKLNFLSTENENSNDPKVLAKEIERLKIERGDLAAQLEKAHIQLRMQAETTRHEKKEFDLEITKLNLQLRGALARAEEYAKVADMRNQKPEHLIEQGGVKYDDVVSEFASDFGDDETSAGSNYFEIHFGSAQMDENSIKQVVDKSAFNGGNGFLSFLTVDFYNHDTQYSPISEGLITNYNFQVSYKIMTDEMFLRHLEKGFIKIELYTMKEAQAKLVASGIITLEQVLNSNSREDVSGIVNREITLKRDDFYVGVIAFKMRMRYPIGELIKWRKEKRELGILDQPSVKENEEFVLQKKRKLVFVIDKATGLPKQCSAFAFFNFNGVDIYTHPLPGPEPHWDFQKTLELVANEEVTSILRTRPLEIIIFDDNIPLDASTMSTNRTDLLGICKISLANLLDDDFIDLLAELRNFKDEKIGSLKFKAFWHWNDAAVKGKGMERADETLIGKTWDEDISMRIGGAIKAKQLNLSQAFLIFDVDRDKLISLKDFQTTVLITLGVPLHKDEVEVFYERLPKPFHMENFIMKFAPYCGRQTEISDIQNILNMNTAILQRGGSEPNDYVKVALINVLKNKIASTSEEDVFKELDSNGDGYVSLTELHRFYTKAGIPNITPDMLQSLFKDLDTNKDGKINLLEFFKFAVGMKYKLAESIDMRREPIRLDLTEKELMIQKLLQYMNSKSISYIKLYEKIDKDRSGQIDKQELGKFFKNELGVDIKNKVLSEVMGVFDDDSNAKINAREFVETLKREANKYSVKPQMFNAEDSISMRIVMAIVNYCKGKGMTPGEVFNLMDKNNNGWISRAELTHYLKNIFKVEVSAFEESSLYDYFDSNGDNKISISEFLKIFQPAMQKGENSMLSSSRKMPPLLSSKINTLITKNFSVMLSSFKICEDYRKKGFCTQDDFKRTFKNALSNTPEVEMNNEQIQMLIDTYLERAADGKVNFQNLFDGRESPEEALLKSQKKAKDIFKKIADVIKKQKVNVKEAFQRFDLDGNGTISYDEFKQVFKMMGLKYSDEEIQDIMNVIDTRADGEIEYKEFFKALQL